MSHPDPTYDPLSKCCDAPVTDAGVCEHCHEIVGHQPDNGDLDIEGAFYSDDMNNEAQAWLEGAV